MWVYKYLIGLENARRKEKGLEPRKAVNSPLVHEIGRNAITKTGKPYKTIWAHMKVKELRQGIKEGAA